MYFLNFIYNYIHILIPYSPKKKPNLHVGRVEVVISTKRVTKMVACKIIKPMFKFF